MSTLTDYLSINQSQTDPPIISAEEEIRQVEIEWGDAFEHHDVVTLDRVGSSRVDLQACKLEYSIVSPK